MSEEVGLECPSPRPGLYMRNTCETMSYTIMRVLNVSFYAELLGFESHLT